MKIKTLISQETIIPRWNNIYNSDAWYLHTVSRLDSLLSRLAGNREIFDELTMEDNRGREDVTRTVECVKGAVDALFELNCYKYRHLWTLYTADYNPLWNVDGTEKETVTRNRTNTGTQATVASGKDTAVMSGNETNKKTGDDTNVQSGSIKDQNARTTFDSSTALDTDSSTTTFNTHQNKTTYNSTDTHTYNNVQDETTYGKTDTRTDNLAENETITTVKERGGNIGVTMTTQLEESEFNWALMFRFMEDLVADIAGAISYTW